MRVLAPVIASMLAVFATDSQALAAKRSSGVANPVGSITQAQRGAAVAAPIAIAAAASRKSTDRPPFGAIPNSPCSGGAFL
jgi:hypothetical protein